MVSPPFCLYTVLSLGILGTLALETIHREGDLHVANRKIAPDGWKRSAVLAGKSLATVDIPGPLITANRGDRLKINVVDELSDTSMVRATSIHWHGIFQKGTNWADGVASVTQCPIIPGESFLYNFLVPEPGTYWYHSHISVQYCDGLRGPLVIYDPEDPYKGEYDVDDESTVLTIADWYHRTARDILATQAAPAPNATLINGKGRYPENPTAPFSVINVEHGKRYRFRLISMSCDPSHTFSIDGHNFTIIETDGQYTQPHTVTSIFLHAGQRYSIILHANQKIGNYWIRASPDNGPVGYENGINSAILRYSGSPSSEPQPSTHPTPTGPGSELKEYDLAPLFSPQAPGRPRPGGADVTFDITLGFALPASFLMNGVQWKTPSVPVLLQMLSGQRHPKSLVPNGLVYLIPKGAIVEVNLHGGDAPGGPHPFHLHGHAFSVVKHGDIDVYNFQNPVRRDVTYVSTGNLTTIRFTTNNTGPWFLHCHKDFHLEDGLAAVLAEDIEDVKEEVVPPDEWKNLCPTYEEFSQTYPADSP